MLRPFLKELVGKDSGLQKSINDATNFKVDPAILDAVGEVVFCDEFFGDIRETDANVFGTVERSTEIEVADVKGDEFGAPTREDAVDDELDEFNRGGFSADVAGITYAVVSNGDVSAVGIRFSRADFADDLCVSDFLVAVGGYGIVVDD